MSLVRTGAFWVVILPVLCVAQLEPAGCRSYEPALVALHGTLHRKTFAGPPNYRDIRKGDKPETYWLLNLDPQIVVSKDKPEPNLNPSQKNVRRVQRGPNQEENNRFKCQFGKKDV